MAVAPTAVASSPRPFEHHVLDFLAYLEFERGLSRNTLEAYRSDLLQFGHFLTRDGLDATTLGHAELARFLSELTAGGPQRPPVAPATIQRKTACLRSFYRHLRREEIISHDPTADLRVAAQEPEAAAGAHARRDRQAPRRAARRRPRSAARPRAARAHVRLRPARERGRRPDRRQRRPARRRRARARQGLQGAADPRRSPGGDRGADLPRARAPEARRHPRGAPPVRQPPRQRAHAPGALQDRAAPRGQRRPRRADEPAHAAPHVRDASAGRAAATCARCRRCSATPTSRRRRSTRTSPPSA